MVQTTPPFGLSVFFGVGPPSFVGFEGKPKGMDSTLCTVQLFHHLNDLLLVSPKQNLVMFAMLAELSRMPSVSAFRGAEPKAGGRGGGTKNQGRQEHLSFPQNDWKAPSSPPPPPPNFPTTTKWKPQAAMRTPAARLAPDEAIGSYVKGKGAALVGEHRGGALPDPSACPKKRGKGGGDG